MPEIQNSIVFGLFWEKALPGTTSTGTPRPNRKFAAPVPASP